MKENPFTWILQGEQTQAQSLTNPNSSKLLYNEFEIKKVYNDHLMIRLYNVSAYYSHFIQD